MDSIVSSRAASVPVVQPRVELSPVKGSAPTELPQTDQSVAASAGSEHPRSGDRHAGHGPIINPATARVADEAREDIEREYEYDDRADELVYRKVNRVTGEIVTQVPAEALVKLRAYIAETATPHLAVAPPVSEESGEDATDEALASTAEPGTLVEKVV